MTTRRIRKPTVALICAAFDLFTVKRLSLVPRIARNGSSQITNFIFSRGLRVPTREIRREPLHRGKYSGASAPSRKLQRTSIVGLLIVIVSSQLITRLSDGHSREFKFPRRKNISSPREELDRKPLPVLPVFAAKLQRSPISARATLAPARLS